MHSFRFALLAGLLAQLAISVRADSVPRLEIPFSDPARGRLVKIELRSDEALSIRGSERKTVLVESSHEKSGAQDVSSLSGTNSIFMNVEAHEQDNVVVLKITPGKSLNIQVPHDSRLQVDSLRDGSVSVENVDGEINASGQNGLLVIKSGAGPLLANTVDGKISVYLDFLPGDKLISLRSLDGTIELGLPSEVRADATLECPEGSITSDFKIERTHTAVSDSTHTITGTINGGGGAKIRLATHDGRIKLLSTRITGATRSQKPKP
jgi:hypothetical protein